MSDCSTNAWEVPEMTELLPCPFCGGEARESGERFENTILSWVYCASCGAAGGYRHTEAEAIAAWNTRAERTCHRENESEAFICSECGGSLPGWRRDNYCPNCGCKVVEP